MDLGHASRLTVLAPGDLLRRGKGPSVPYYARLSYYARLYGTPPLWPETCPSRMEHSTSPWTGPLTRIGAVPAYPD